MDRHTLAQRALLLVGISSLVLGLAGLSYNCVMLPADYSSFLQDWENEINTEQFYTALYVMSGICVAFYTALLVIGTQLIRRKSGWAMGLLGLIILEVFYYVIIGIMWKSPQYGMSVAAASGVSSGGLSFQVFTLFPVWGPLADLWAGRIQAKVL